MRSEFNKAELNVLNNLKQYRYISIVCMIAFTTGIMFAIYFSLCPEATYESRHINMIRLNGMVIMLGLSFFLFTCIRTIEKLESVNKSEKHSPEPE
ncbi:hypothetical protein [Geomesophilobacter sediminis]|uniref:Uncharacterized protein n=1 Tax=Geomesophilobacter sediminis TaxID=2798584 RepID=A0A8J7M2F4_9BACT|nr:hypothetical protein [Geomesophilobacter sediminis]MBJ6727508.1 hypothetical protein [Geomesophilobacter sediminis]